MSPSNLPDRFHATPLRSSDTAFARRATDLRKPEIDDAAADRADGLALEHALKVAKISPKEVAEELQLDESNVYQWFTGKPRAPIGRISAHFPKFELAYLQARVAQSEHLMLSLTVCERPDLERRRA